MVGNKKLFSMAICLAVLALSVFVAGDAAADTITSSGDPALSGATVIDFEAVATGTYTSLPLSGVTFTPAENHLRIDATYAGSYNTTGISLDNGTYGDNGFGTLTMTFDSPTSAFGFNWGAADSGTWTLRGYSSSDVLLESYVLPNTAGGNAGTFVGLEASGMAYATLSHVGGFDWVFVDNFTFVGGAAVPEPGTLALLALGLVGVGYGRRRRRAGA